MADYQINLGMSDGSTIKSNKFSIIDDTRWSAITEDIKEGSTYIVPNDDKTPFINFFDENWGLKINGTLKIQFYYISYNKIKVMLVLYTDYTREGPPNNDDNGEYNGYVIFSFDIDGVNDAEFPSNSFLSQSNFISKIDELNVYTDLNGIAADIQYAFENDDFESDGFNIIFNLLYIEFTKGENSTAQFLWYKNVHFVIYSEGLIEFNGFPGYDAKNNYWNPITQDQFGEPSSFRFIYKVLCASLGNIYLVGKKISEKEIVE